MAVLNRTAQAEDDLIDIWLHIAQDNPAAADALLDALDDCSRLLATLPDMGPARDDIADGLQYFPHDNPLILYRCIKGGVQVVRDLHGARVLFGLALNEPVSPIP